MPDRTGPEPEQALSQETPRGDGAIQEVDDPLDRVSRAIDAEFTLLFGAAGPDARAALTRAAASEGPAAYSRFGTSPEQYGTVGGDRSRATNLGRTLEAYNYSRSVQTAERDGRPADVIGAWPTAAPEASPDPRSSALRMPEQTGYDVLNAVQTIRNSLAENLSNRVTHEDLVAAERAVRGLSREDATAAVGRLSDADLRQWAEELDDQYVLPEFRGYDAAERSRLFGGLAQKLDGAQLARFAQAPDVTALAEDGRAFGAAVGAYTPADDRVAFVRAMDLKTASPDAAAAAVVGAVAGIGTDGRRVAEALAGADAAGIQSLVDAGIARVSAQTHGVGYQSYDVQPAWRMLHNIAATGDARLIGEAFVGASAAIAERAPGDRGGSAGATLEAQSWQRAAAGLRGGQTALLGAATNEVVDRLLTQHFEGKELTGYAEALIELGDSGTLGRHVAHLQRGDSLSETAVNRFGHNAPTGSTPEQVDRASRLGYAVGAVSTAFDNRTTALRADVQELAGVLQYVVPKRVFDIAKEGFNHLVIDGEVATIDEARRLLADEAVPTGGNDDKYSQIFQRDYDGARTTVSQFSSK